jgi:hypothetical protein
MVNLDKEPQIEYVCYELVGRRSKSYIHNVANVIYNQSYVLIQDMGDMPIVIIPLQRLLELRIKYKED